MSLIKRKPTEEDEIEKKTQKANLVHVVQEDELAACHKPPDEELLKTRNLKLQVKKLRRFFKYLVIYVVYVLLLVIVCYADRKPSSYLQTKTLKDTFSSFYQVKDARSFWTWFEEELVPGLYDSEKSLSGNGTGMISGKIGFIVGLPKIRQIRIKSGQG
ncbi:polycystin-2-like [Stylophora pistillata]|uniref:polycystin-2-like n=1 Tax=Stylophora pistillata TaxID=50429 RepID=UPI000C04D6A4|nr:polycystin-2-like [Stylophora pistillata]